ncbi:MAG TPA: hypothetical protein VGH54_29530 [Mycobacterium sp.]|uniref:hypothetical protein n=1 Tax=Mycobacterium sp. TaxID=1785 RepID=UPI002F4063B7
MAENSLTDAIGEIRKTFNRPFSADRDTSLQRLLLAAEVVSHVHGEDILYGLASDEDHPGACPHDPQRDWDQHFEADSGEWCCTDLPSGSECHCGADWPCEEYAAVLGALTGQGTTTVLAVLKEKTSGDG